MEKLNASKLKLIQSENKKNTTSINATIVSGIALRFGGFNFIVYLPGGQFVN